LKIRVNLDIVSIKFLENIMTVECVVKVGESKSPLVLNIPLVGEKTKHLRTYKDLIQTQILEYLSEDNK
jgi:hypothetical protein